MARTNRKPQPDPGGRRAALATACRRPAARDPRRRADGIRGKGLRGDQAGRRGGRRRHLEGPALSLFRQQGGAVQGSDPADPGHHHPRCRRPRARQRQRRCGARRLPGADDRRRAGRAALGDPEAGHQRIRQLSRARGVLSRRSHRPRPAAAGRPDQPRHRKRRVPQGRPRACRQEHHRAACCCPSSGGTPSPGTIPVASIPMR